MTPAEPAQAEAGTVLPCLGVPTFVRTLGAGPPVFVLHGGPGFSHDYLVAPLRGLARRRRLIFFDQPGCGRSGNPDQDLTPDLVARHFRALVRQLLPRGAGFGVLTHSWGAAVLYAADLAGEDGGGPEEGLVVTPVPTTRAAWDAAVAYLLARISPAVAAAFLGSLQSAADADFDPLLPFYCASATPAAAGTIRVRGATYLSTVAHLGDYDLRAQARRAASRLNLALGRFDFTPPDLLDDLASAARRSTLFETGHFPFWEDPVAFEAALQAAFP